MHFEEDPDPTYHTKSHNRPTTTTIL